MAGINFNMSRLWPSKDGNYRDNNGNIVGTKGKGISSLALAYLNSKYGANYAKRVSANMVAGNIYQNGSWRAVKADKIRRQSPIINLPNITITAKYPSEDEIKKTIESRWKSAINLPFYKITKDPTFTRERTGAGSIEYFHTPEINYGTLEHPNNIKNPNGNIPTLVFDPNTNTVDDILLDLLHHYRFADPKYLLYLKTYTQALTQDLKGLDDVLYNSNLGELFRNKYTTRNSKGKIIKEDFDKHWDEWDKLVQLNKNNLEYLILGIDGSLRDLLATNYMRKHSNYLSLKEANKLWLKNDSIYKAFNNLNNYLKLGK